MKTRVPSLIGEEPVTPGYAWEKDGAGNLRLSGKRRLTQGQAFVFDGDYRPSSGTITDDPHWTRDGSGNLTPIF